MNVFGVAVSLESHSQWGRPGGLQGAPTGGPGEDAEGEASSLISQTVAMAIAGTSAASPISRPSSFLLNSQVIAVVPGMSSNRGANAGPVWSSFFSFWGLLPPCSRPDEPSTR